MSDFSALSSIDSNLNSLSEELMLNVNRDESIAFAVESSTSIDELADKLTLIERANKGQSAALVDSVLSIRSMIHDNMSLDDIKLNL